MAGLKYRFKNSRWLWKKVSLLFYIAIYWLGIFTISRVHIASYTFVNGLIFGRQIKIIPIVREKVFQFTLKAGNLKNTLITNNR